MAQKPLLYVNKFSGDIRQVHPLEVATLSEDWSKIQFVKNAHGDRVMRFELNGATVEVGEKEVAQHGNPSTK